MNQSMPIKRHCSRCDEWKPRTQFYPAKKGERNKKFQSMCVPCYTATYNTAYRKGLEERRKLNQVSRGRSIESWSENS